MEARNLPLGRILVPVDFSAASEEAVRRAVALADRFEAEVTLLNVLDTSVFNVSEVSAYLDVSDVVDGMREGARRNLEALAATVDPEQRRAIRVEVREGRPVDAIVQRAADTDAGLIVMGTHGRTGLGRLLLGSVAERVARHAPCDVMVVPAPQPKEVAR